MRPLLDAMVGRFDVLITADQSIPYQNTITGRQLSVIVLRARSNRMSEILPVVPNILSALATIMPGDVFEVTT